MAAKRVDYYSDEEYSRALEQEEYVNRWAMEEEGYKRHLEQEYAKSMRREQTHEGT